MSRPGALGVEVLEILCAFAERRAHFRAFVARDAVAALARVVAPGHLVPRGGGEAGMQMSSSSISVFGFRLS